jgi:hypothetical protein
MVFKTILKVAGRISGGSGGRERALAQLSGFEYKLISLVEFAFRENEGGRYRHEEQRQEPEAGQHPHCRRQAD